MKKWALILGASSGFGAATARELVKRGLHIIGVHFDRKSAMPAVEKLINELRATGQQVFFFNVNAADPEKRKYVCDEIERIFGSSGDGNTIKVLMHSLAFGTLRPFISDDPGEVITPQQMDMTLEVMAHTLVYWTQEVVMRGLMKEGGRIFAMTSSGSERVIPYYGAVSAAKAALESHVRQLALELAPRGITVNAIRAGVTDTPALRKIPGHQKLVEEALKRNPSGRLTRPEDVAKAIATLISDDLYWMTGNVINVDGGEDITG